MRHTHINWTQALRCLGASAFVLAVPGKALGTPRVQAHQIERMRAGLADLLSDPSENFGKLGACVRGADASVVKQVEAAAGKATDAADIAALSFVLAEAGYWRAFEALRSGSEAAKRSLPDRRSELLPRYLDAWEHGIKSGSRAVTTSAEARLLGIAAGRSFGGELSESDRNMLVERFIRPAEGLGRSDKWPAGQRLRVYANLGIGDELGGTLNLGSNASFGEIAGFLAAMNELSNTNGAAAVARDIVAKWPAEVFASPRVALGVWTAFGRVNAFKAFEWLKTAATRQPWLQPYLYEQSLELEPHLALDERRRLYLADMTAENFTSLPSRRPSARERRWRTAQALFNGHDYETCHEICKTQEDSGWSFHQDYRFLAAECLERLGRPDEAIAAYRRIAAKSTEGGIHAKAAGRAEGRIRALERALSEQQDATEKEIENR